MEFLILIHANERAERPPPGGAEFELMMTSWAAFNQDLFSNDEFIAGANLQPSETATTVTWDSQGTPDRQQGSLLPPSNALGGFYLVRVPDLDRALELAARIPLPEATVEVRPVAFRPDPG